MTIDHKNVTCDASNWRTGTVFSVGPSWEPAWPVAFNSIQLKGLEKNYPVHEKELLVIVSVPKK